MDEPRTPAAEKYIYRQAMVGRGPVDLAVQAMETFARSMSDIGAYLHSQTPAKQEFLVDGLAAVRLMVGLLASYHGISDRVDSRLQTHLTRLERQASKEEEERHG